MRLLLCLALLCSSNVTLLANESMEAEIGALVEPLVEERLIPGYHVAFYGKEGLLFEKSGGLADDKTNLQPGSEVLYFVDSMSKPLTALLMIRLQEQGKLQFDDPIEKFLPQFADLQVLDVGSESERLKRAQSKVTIRQLLTHTSGFTTSMASQISNPVVVGYKQQRVMTRNSTANSKLGDLAAQVTKLAEFPLLFEPGTRFDYSVGYDVAGRIAEVVTGEDLATAMQTYVFQPLGMSDSHFIVPPEKHARLARLYGPHGRSYQVPGKPKRYRKYAGIPRTQANFGIATDGYFSGSIGVLTTASDYSKLLQMILNDGAVNGKRWLSKAGLQRLTADQLPKHLPPGSISRSMPAISNSGYSFGVGIKLLPEEKPSDRKQYEYLYWAGDANTQFFVDIETGVAGIFMTQHLPTRYFFLDRMHELAVLHLTD